MAYCKKCGYEIPDGAKFCGKCGQPVEDAKESEKLKKAGKPLGVIAVVLAVVVGVAVFVGVAGRGFFAKGLNRAHSSEKPGLYNEDGKMLESWDSLIKKDHLTLSDNGTLYKGDKGDEIKKKKSLKLVLPDDVTRIGEEVFDGWSNLKSIKLSHHVTSIGAEAFFNSGLKDIDIPFSVTSIGMGAFSWTPWLEAKQEEDPLVIVNHILIDGTGCEGDVSIPDGVTIIGASAFSECENLTSIEIPSSVINIGALAFDGCSKLTSIGIPSSVTSIGSLAFNGCSGLEDISVPSDVTYIGGDYGAFMNCSNLKSILWKGDTYSSADAFERAFEYTRQNIWNFNTY